MRSGQPWIRGGWAGPDTVPPDPKRRRLPVCTLAGYRIYKPYHCPLAWVPRPISAHDDAHNSVNGGLDDLTLHRSTVKFEVNRVKITNRQCSYRTCTATSLGRTARPKLSSSPRPQRQTKTFSRRT
ncbi:hypothetical protein GW17_00043634 [Ensete ventricosum]|nr:hypothetical protein GW17_00043634 [Ensete ventricosum]